MTEIPPMPHSVDFIDNIVLHSRATTAMLQGAPKDIFEWQPDMGTSIGTPYRYHSDELLKRNLAALQRWESVQEAKQQAAREVSSRKKPVDLKGSERDRALGILRWAENRLSQIGEGVRDDATRDTIYYLGAFVNDGYLTENDVEVSIISASYKNGLAYDRENGGIAKIRKDIPRGLTKAASDGTHVDFDDMDRRTND